MDRETALNKVVAELESVSYDLFNNIFYRYPVFYCGGYGEFGQIASDAIDIFRKRHPDIQSEKLFVTPYLTPSYLKVNKYMKEFYDGIVYPPLENVPPKFAIARRNQWMIDRCDLLIAYMENTAGNTRKCVEYAISKQKTIVYADSGESAKLLNLSFRRSRKPN